MPKLVISLPDAGEVIHELTDSTLTVGRTEGNSVQIDDASVSTHHAELTETDGVYVLTDLGSTNGTYINGEPVEGSKKLRAGDRVRFGKVDAIYEVPGESPVQPLPEEQGSVAAPAASSRRPGDFGNASPFQRKKVSAKPLSIAAILLFVLALGGFGAAVYYTTLIQVPGF